MRRSYNGKLPSALLGMALILYITPSFAAAAAKNVVRAQDATGTADKNKANKSGGRKKAPTSERCDSRAQVQQFNVDASGSVSDSGRTIEGPRCIDVFYNPIQLYVSLGTVTSVVAGPDLTKTVLGSSTAGGVRQIPAEVKKNLPNTVADLIAQERNLKSRLAGIKSSYAVALQQQQKAIADISLLRRTTLVLSASQAPDAVLNGYKGLKEDLASALLGSGKFQPTDQPSDQQVIFLNQLQQLSDKVAGLPLQFTNGTKVDPSTIVCVPDDQHPETRELAWADWAGKCKDPVLDTLKAAVDADILDTKNYISDSDNTKKLIAKIAVVQYWDALFTRMGLRTTMTSDELKAIDISRSFYAYTTVRCGVLFNQTANTAVNIVAADLGPTLDGNDPTVKAQGAFVTVSCGTPFSVTAGVAFSTIEQKQFAIIKSPGGTGNPSINIFGTTSDSKINPMPIGMVHVRLAEWAGHKYAFHASFGVAGNLQGQGGGGSTAEFLPGVSFSFWRTMYVSFGPDIGTKAELAGGFKENAAVPSDITSIDGLIKRSRTVGFGFAITFTKP